ncbi:MAG: hypothetical protein DMG68_20025, partial [Acidobacteria bacterium]
EQLAKLAGADRDGWNSPLDFVFGKSNVPSRLTGDIFDGVTEAPIAFVHPSIAAPVQHSGVSMSMGGPWAYYEDFR